MYRLAPIQPGGGSVMTDCTERSEGQEGTPKLAQWH